MKKVLKKIKLYLLGVVIFLPILSYSANWIPVGELNAEKDSYEIDYDSIKLIGIRPSFYARTNFISSKSEGLFKPQYNQQVNLNEVDCDKGNIWPQNQARLFDGKLITTITNPSPQPFPILPGTQMEAITGLICYLKINEFKLPKIFQPNQWVGAKSRNPEGAYFIGENYDDYQNRLVTISKQEFSEQPKFTKLPVRKTISALTIDCKSLTQAVLLSVIFDSNNKTIAGYFQNAKVPNKVLDENTSRVKNFCDTAVTSNKSPTSESSSLGLDTPKLEAQLKLDNLRSSDVNATGNRRALVIGNDTYKTVAKLSNAREDARTIAANLTSVGYQVTLKLDLNEKEMKTALRNFASQVQGGDEVLFFFAGHGVQLGATNYLLPTDIIGDSEAQVRDEAIQLQRLLDDMSERKAKFTLAMIDACRDNPFKSSGRAIGGKGLAPTTAATGQMVIFSAGTGQQALDKLSASDKNKNGLFTRIFIQEMQKPNQSVDRVVKNVRNQVAELAKSVGHEQVPAIYDQVLGDFYFKK